MKTPLKYLLNPCDIDRLKVLAPIGDSLAFIWGIFTGKTECPCCLGARLLVLAAVAFAAGKLL